MANHLYITTYIWPIVIKKPLKGKFEYGYVEFK